MSRITPLGVLLGLLTTACGSTTHTPSPLAIPPPCANNDTIYFGGPAAHGSVKSASLASLILPPPGFRGTAQVRLLVEKSGNVLAESTHVDGVSAQNAAALKRTLADYQFRPATLDSCAVNSWFELRVSGP